MKIQFNINYHTVFGQELYVNLQTAEGRFVQHRMHTNDGSNWDVTINVKEEERGGNPINYFYTVNHHGKHEREEWRVEPHRLNLSTGSAIVYDHWIDIPENAYLYTSAFTECIVRERLSTQHLKNYDRTVRLKVRAPQLREGERLAVTGSCKMLGEWVLGRAVPMSEHNYNEWLVSLDADKIEGDFLEFKFVVINENKEVSPIWEGGQNRRVDLPHIKKGELVVYELEEALFPIYAWKGAGTVVPVFSLRSKDSFGVGDFGDLRKMIDWLVKTGQRVLQVLPINDTTITKTWMDSYPYNSISIYALHPQYIDLSALPPLDDEKAREEFERLREELNALPQIDYERVNDAKTRYLRLLFGQEGKKTMATASFRKFFEANRHWLVPYAAFCHYRDLYGTATFSEWPEEHRAFTYKEQKDMENPRTRIYKEVSFFYFVQYHLDTQMRAAHEYARRNGIILKGDIPIGICRDSVEAWTEPHYFNLNGQAGAPPDAFSANGQNWGFPTYNWDEMLADGCRWWVGRFQKMAQYFDAYRIDHVQGFFRIWEIPIHSVHGLLGQFSPALPMSADEIESYGLHFREQFFTQPYIADWTLDRIFGQQAQQVKEVFVDHIGDDRYRMKPEFDTQRKVEAYFKSQEEPLTAEQTHLRDGLYSLISDVLFVRDRKQADKYHPRISAQLDCVYQALSDEEKRAFNQLYNDYFYRRNNQFWYHEAMKKLPLLTQATRMLVCAEDLGMVPDCVPWVINELRILSLEIQSMPKEPNCRFGHLSRNPYRSVDTISTHDMPTLRGWWKEDRMRTQEYYNQSLYRGGEAPDDLPGWLARDIVSRHLTSPSMLCLLSLQDWLSTDEKLRLPDADAERINVPANPRHYWRWRMHISIEDLMQCNAFNEDIAALINQSGRR